MTEKIITPYHRLAENKSLFFCLPMLGDNIRSFMNLRGCFIGDEDYPQFNNNIFILYRRDISEEYKTYIEFAKLSPYHRHSYQPDDFHDMLVYDIPINNVLDYSKFRQSKYSELSHKYKQHIIRFFNLTKMNSDGSLNKIVAILYKDPAYRKQREEELLVTIPEDLELGSLLDPQLEMYDDSMKIKTSMSNSDLLPQ